MANIEVPKLTEILKDTETMKDAFSTLEGKDILMYTIYDVESNTNYVPLMAKLEFVILEIHIGFGRKNLQLLHPYGSMLAYYIEHTKPD